MCTNPLLRYFDHVKNTYRITSLVSVLSSLARFGVRKQNYEKFLRCRFKDYQVLRCGQCGECKIKRSREWTSRMMMELESKNGEGMMLTLTYDDSKLNCYNDLDKNINRGISLIKRDVQNFCKRFRKWLSENHPGSKIKYYACGEYGSNTFRPHYHILILGYRFSVDDGLRSSVHLKSHKGFPLYECTRLNELWKYGLATVSDVSSSSIQYVCKYIQKREYVKHCPDEFNPYIRILNHNVKNHRKTVYNIDVPDIVEVIPEFANMSTKTSIGFEYIMENYKELLSRFNYCIDPIKNLCVGLPRYFKRFLELFDKKALVVYKLKIKQLVDKFDPYVLDYEYLKKCIAYRIKNNFEYCPI